MIYRVWNCKAVVVTADLNQMVVWKINTPLTTTCSNILLGTLKDIVKKINLINYNKIKFVISYDNTGKHNFVPLLVTF